MERIADSLLNVVRLIVDNPDDVSMEIVPQMNSVQLRLLVAPDDAGKVIGKQGRTARSLRTLLSAMSKTSEKTISLEIVESA